MEEFRRSVRAGTRGWRGSERAIADHPGNRDVAAEDRQCWDLHLIAVLVDPERVCASRRRSLRGQWRSSWLASTIASVPVLGRNRIVGYFESFPIAISIAVSIGTIKAKGEPVKSHHPLLPNLRTARLIKAIHVRKNTKPRTIPPILPLRLSTASGPRKAATNERIRSGANFCRLGANSSSCLKMLSDDYAALPKAQNPRDATNVTVRACRDAVKNLASTSRRPRKEGCESAIGVLQHLTLRSYYVVKRLRRKHR